MQRHRLEQDTSERRARAHAHLDRVRHGRKARREPGARLRNAFIVLAALLAGAWLGEPLAELATGMGSRPLEQIAVRGATHLTPAEIAEETGLARDTTVGDVDADTLARSLEAHDWIASARTLRLPGGTLVLSVVEREPVATVAVGETVYAVDAEGRPFAPLAEESDLPRLVAETVTPGEADPQLAEAVRLAERLEELGLSPAAEVRVAAEDDPEGYAIRLASLPVRVVLGRSELDARLDDLAQLMTVRPDEVAQATDIDLRFANQVVLRSSSTRDGSTSSAAAGGRPTSHTRQPAG